MKAKIKGLIIDVVPIAHLPLGRQQFYSYLGEKELKAGTLVDIPLFKRSVEGIVLGSRTDFERLGNIQLKKINKIIEESFLTKEQLELANFIAEYYFCSLGTVLKFFIPKRMKERNKKQEARSKQITKEIRLTKEQKEAVDKIASNKDDKFLLFGPASSGKTEVYIKAVAEILAKNKKSQFLILLPELTLTPQATERYAHLAAPEEIVVLHSKISKGQLWSAWQKIKSGEAKIIIGTRMAVFAPFQNLKLIVIDEEQDISFKQWDMHPKYDARKVAEKIAELHQAKIVFGSATPSVDTYWRAMNREINLLTLPELNLEVESMMYNVSNKNEKIHDTFYKIPSTKIQIVDMKKERWNKNTSIISKALKGELAYALKNKLQTILFINRQGMSAFSICEKCKTVLSCPKCDRALVYDENGTYHCLHCNHRTGAFVNCPKCNEMVFKNIGIGTQKVEREIHHLFPGARIRRVDFESMKKAGDAEKLYQEFGAKDIDIIIGTQMITKGWDLPNVALVGIIDADSLLALPDFKTDEKAFQNIVQVAGRTNRLGSKFPGRVLIQTYNPENFVIRAAADRNYLHFFEKELADRKILKYPPFSQVIKLVQQDYSRAVVEKETEAVYAKLQELKDKNVIFSAPLEPMVNKVRGRFKKQLILKVFQEELPTELSNLLTDLGRGWSIDRDPISIS